ncbi:MAG: response regulator [Acidobacteria bacterium]|nr:response regulator [Acidobacteriota bacterium]
MERVLLIDDEPSVRLFYSDVLAERGFEVVEASSGDEALALIQNEVPDLVVLDIKLGSQSGLTVLQQIVCSNPRLPTILLTGYVSFQDDYTSWLADSYVMKSSDPREFLEEVERTLKNAGVRAAPERFSQAAARALDSL